MNKVIFRSLLAASMTAMCWSTTTTAEALSLLELRSCYPAAKVDFEVFKKHAVIKNDSMTLTLSSNADTVLIDITDFAVQYVNNKTIKRFGIKGGDGDDNICLRGILGDPNVKIIVNGDSGSDYVSSHSWWNAAADNVIPAKAYKKRQIELKGGDGKDILQGHDSDEILRGGDGDDYIVGYEGYDDIFGDAGNDVLLQSFSNHVSTVQTYWLKNHNIVNWVATDSEGNAIWGNYIGPEFFQKGGPFHEGDIGGGGKIEGGPGDDYIEGAGTTNGKNVLIGGEGRDLIIGMNGDNYIYGDEIDSTKDKGKDTLLWGDKEMIGGGDLDTCYYKPVYTPKDRQGQNCLE